MAGITLEQAQAQLEMWLDAEAAIATSQSYSIGDRTLTRADLSSIESAITRWDRRVKQLSRSSGGVGSGPRIRGGTPL